MATTYTLIDKATVGSGGTSSINFNTIPSTYTDLMVLVNIRYSTGGQTATSTWIQFNGLTTNQTSRMLSGNGATASSYTDTKIFAQSNGSTSTASTFGNSQFYIPNYTSSNFKSVSIDGVSENNSTTAYAELAAGLWSSTAAITSITLKEYNGSYTIAENSTAYLYGIKNT
jgi:hypothetical protein